MDNKDLIPVDSLFLTEEEKENVRRMAALGYKPRDLALYLGMKGAKVLLFIQDAYEDGTTINLLIREGTLITKANPEMKLHEYAEAGNIEAIKELEKIKRRHSFESLIDQMDDDELY